MGRISDLFEKKQKAVLNVYCTAGYPQFSSTNKVMQALQDHGADMIELGMPYSDPLADGPVIQASGGRALENGMTIAALMEQLQDFRRQIHVPVLLMGYMNPVLQYGFEKFCSEAAQRGIDGLVLPDLPMHEFEKEYAGILRKYRLDFIFLVTPETSEERIRKLDELSSGFLYAVSSSSTTGREKDMAAQSTYFKRLASMHLKNPILVGFGIRDRKSFLDACRYANGVIIGTAYIKALENNLDIQGATDQFLQSIIHS